MSRTIFLNWSFFCDWWGFAPDERVYVVPDDIQ